MDFVSSRRAKIRSHTVETLSRQALEIALEDDGVSSRTNTYVPYHYLFILVLFSSVFLLLTSRLPSLRFVHIDADHLSHLGAAIGSGLSIVTGLLLCYRANQALKKWETGRSIWMVTIRTEIRDGLRMISLIAPRSPHSSAPSTESNSSSSSSFTQAALDSSSPNLHRLAARRARQSVLESKAEELVGLIVAFTFALQHHLEKTKPLIHRPPLSDLLPPAYISSLKRTDSRVRFAQLDSDDGYDSSTESGGENKVDEKKGRKIPKRERKRRVKKGISSIQSRSRNMPSPNGGPRDPLRDIDSTESPEQTAIQVEEVNVHHPANESSPVDGSRTPQPAGESTNLTDNSAPGSGCQTPRPKPVLSNVHPPNLPLSVLRLMEGYVNEFVKAGEMDRREWLRETTERGRDDEWESWGWTAAQGEKGWSMVKRLSTALAEAELLGADPPSLSLSTHLSHLLMIYILSIPLQLIHSLGRWSVLVAVVGGWALWGLEGISTELEGVFGRSTNHLPLSRYSNVILEESMNNPLFARMYTARVRARMSPGSAGSGTEGDEVDEMKKIDDWTPFFANGLG